MSLDLKKLLFDSVPASPAYTRSDSRGWIGHIATPTSQLDQQYQEHQQQHVQRCSQLIHAAWGSPEKHKFAVRRVAVPLRLPTQHSSHPSAAPVATSTSTARAVSRNSYCSSPRSTSRRLDIDPGRESVNNWMYDSDMEHEHEHDHDGEGSPSTTLRSFRHGRHTSMSTNPMWDDEVGRVNTNVAVNNTNKPTSVTSQKQPNKSTASNTQTVSQPTQHHRQPSKAEPSGTISSSTAPPFDLAILNASSPSGDSDADSDSDSDGEPDSDVEPEPEPEPFGGFSSGSSSGANSHVPSAVSTVYTSTRNMPYPSNPAPTTHDVLVTDTRVTIRQPNLMVSIPSTSSLLSYGSSAPMSAATPTSAQPTSFPLTSPPRLAPIQMPTSTSATSSSSLLEQPTHTFRSYSSAPSTATAPSNANSPPEARLAPVTQVRLAPVPQPPLAARAPVTTNHPRPTGKRSSMVVPSTINLMKTATSSANSTSTSSSTSTSNSNSTSSTASTAQSSSSSSSVIITARRHSMSYMPSSAVNVKQLSIWEDNNMNLTQSMTSKRYHNNSNNPNTIMINTNNTQPPTQPIPILIPPTTRTNHSRTNPPHKSNTIIVVDTHRRGSTTKFPSPIKSRHEMIS